MSEEIRLLKHFDRINCVKTFKPNPAKQNFKSRFESELQKSSKSIKISKHASKRIDERKINLDENLLKKLSEVIDTVEEKGVKGNALIAMNDNIFIVNIKNRTIITGFNRDDNNRNIFTQIEGALVI